MQVCCKYVALLATTHFMLQFKMTHIPLKSFEKQENKILGFLENSIKNMSVNLRLSY